MKKRIAITLLALTLAVLSAETEEKTLITQRWNGFSLNLYASMGSGMAFTATGEAFPVWFEAASGFQITPWFGFGGFFSISPLSLIADTKGSVAIASGSEFVFTPFSANLVHPRIRFSIGGQTVATENTLIYERFFYTGLSAGPELNVSPQIRLYVNVGWHFTGNTRIIGFTNGELSGCDLSVGGKFLFRSTID